MLKLLIELLKNMSLIAVVAYLLILTRPLRRTLEGAASKKDMAGLTIIFGFMSIAGNYLGIPVMGALANNRMIAPVVGGLLGGPIVGIGAGLIGGVHRFLLGGFTASACAVGNLTAGLIGSLFYLRIGPSRVDGRVALLSGFLSELILKSLVLLMAKPFSAALALERAIALPTIIVNSLGVAIFVLMVQSVRQKEMKAGASYAEKALHIAGQTLPIIRQGLTNQTADKVIRIILEETKCAAAEITDKANILAFAGLGEDHHCSYSGVINDSGKLALSTGMTQVVYEKGGLSCPQENCPLSSAVTVPLIIKDEIVGTLSIFKTNGDKVTDADRKLTEGIGNLLSLQMELARLDELSKLLSKAKFTALKAQLNPHFLFNSISVIMSCCRSNPEEARQLLVHLSRLLRRRLRENDDMVTLRDEMEAVNAYLAITRIRFGEKLEIDLDIEDEALNWMIPVFSIQPIVENAIRHGLIPCENECRLEIKALIKADALSVEIADNGVGIRPQELEQLQVGNRVEGGGVGITNILQRIKLIYGEQARCIFNSSVGRGTRVFFTFPQI